MNASEKVSYATGLHSDVETLIEEGKTKEANELIEKAAGLMDEAESETKALRGFDDLKARIDMPVNVLPVSVEDQKAWNNYLPLLSLYGFDSTWVQIKKQKSSFTRKPLKYGCDQSQIQLLRRTKIFLSTRKF